MYVVYRFNYIPMVKQIPVFMNTYFCTKHFIYFVLIHFLVNAVHLHTLPKLLYCQKWGLKMANSKKCHPYMNM